MTEVLYAYRNLFRNKIRTFILIFSILFGLTGILYYAMLSRGMTNVTVQRAIEMGLGHFQITHKTFPLEKTPAYTIPGGYSLIQTLRTSFPFIQWVGRVLGDGILTSPRGMAFVELRGIDFAEEKSLTLFASKLIQGSYPSGRKDIFIGDKLLKKLEITVGDKVVLTLSDKNGELQSELLYVRGVFHVPSREMNERLVIIHRGLLASILGVQDELHEIVGVTSQGDIDTIKQRILTNIDFPTDTLFTTWRERSPGLYYEVKMFNLFNYFAGIILFIALGMGTANVFTMAILERGREFGLLRAVGLSNRFILRSLLYEAFLIYISSILAGIGITLMFYFAGRDGISLGQFQQAFETMGLEARIPLVLSLKDFVVYPAFLGICLFASITFPLRRVLNMKVSEVLRHG